MKRTLSLLFFFTLAFFSNAQTSYKPSKATNSKDSLARFRFEVGTDLLWLIDKNSLPGYCLQLRINTNSKNHSGAFRLKVGMDMENKDSTWAAFPDEYYRTSDETFYFRPGYQLSSTFSRVKLYWGADLHFLYSKRYLDKYDRLVDMNNTYYKSFYTSTNTTMQYGVIGVAGVAYHLTPRISVSLEANISLLYSKIKLESYFYYKENPDYKMGIGKTGTSLLNIKVLPISNINLAINF